MSKNSRNWFIAFIVVVICLPTISFFNVKEVKSMKDIEKSSKIYTLARYTLPMENPEKIGKFSYNQSRSSNRKGRASSSSAKNIHNTLYKVNLTDGYVYTFEDTTNDVEQRYIFDSRKVDYYGGFNRVIIARPESVTYDDYIVMLTDPFSYIVYKVMMFGFAFFIFKAVSKKLYKVIVTVANHFK